MDVGFQDSDVLVIGLGGHKCGSTWVYRYLRDHPECHAPLIKELAYFSDEGNYDWLWRARGRMKTAFSELVKFEELFKNPDEISDKTRSQYDEMRALLMDLNQNVASLTGHAPYAVNFAQAQGETRLIDITPAYALLDDESYAKMSMAHSDVRVLFSMRDPAERVFSAFRYAFKRRSKGLAPRPKVRLQQLQEWLEGRPTADEQTDYPSILDKMERHFPKDKQLVYFYENLFCDASLQRICAFLGIEFRPGNYEMRIHQTDSENSPVKMNDIEREFLVERYGYVYKEIKSRFGAEAPSQWNWPDRL